MAIQGDKFDRNLSGVEITRALRADIKALVKAGKLPRAKYSVTLDKFSLGQSITITFADVPWNLFDHDYLLNEVAGKKYWPIDKDRYSVEHRDLVVELEVLGSSYNRVDSRPQEDYFHAKFYLHVRADSDFERKRRALEVQALKAELELAELALEHAASDSDSEDKDDALARAYSASRNAKSKHASSRSQGGAPVDPNANLRQQLAIAEEVLDSDEVDADALPRLAELVVQLDEWMRVGGFPPSRWQKRNVGRVESPQRRQARLELQYPGGVSPIEEKLVEVKPVEVKPPVETKRVYFWPLRRAAVGHG